MVPGAEYSPSERTQRPVWQLAFYAPLEETKGIKLFCDAVEQLPKTLLARPGFEVHIIGEEAKIDQKLSLPWLRERTAHWTWRTHILPSPTRCAHPSALGASACSGLTFLACLILVSASLLLMCKVANMMTH